MVICVFPRKSWRFIGAICRIRKTWGSSRLGSAESTGHETSQGSVHKKERIGANTFPTPPLGSKRPGRERDMGMSKNRRSRLARTENNMRNPTQWVFGLSFNRGY